MCKYGGIDVIASVCVCVCVGVKEEEGLLLGDTIPWTACVLAV